MHSKLTRNNKDFQNKYSILYNVSILNICFYYFLCPDPIDCIVIFFEVFKFSFCLLFFLSFDGVNLDLLVVEVPLHPVQVVHLSLDHPDHVGGGEVAPVVELLASLQSHVLPQLGSQVVLHSDVAHIHLGAAAKVLGDHSLVLRKARLLFGPQFTDKFLATAILVHLRHVSVPVVDIETSSLHLPLDPLQLHHLGMLGVPLASVVVDVVLRGAVVVMSPGLLIPYVVGGCVVVAWAVVIVSDLIAASCSAVRQSRAGQESFLGSQNTNAKTYGHWAEEDGLSEMGETTENYERKLEDIPHGESQ